MFVAGMIETLPERELQNGDKIPFVWQTDRWGRAEFRFCLVYKRDKLKRVYIDPRQQPETATERWFIECHGNQTFSTFAWTHQGIQNCYIWRHMWCKEHRGPAFDLYVPDYSTHFEIYGPSDIYFGYDPELARRIRRKPDEHYHCPLGCEHPQPLTDLNEIICGRCWFVGKRRTVMILCSPETCSD